MAKAKMIGSHSLAGSTSAANSSLARSNSCGPASDWAVGAGKLLFETGQGPANQAQHAFLGDRLGFFVASRSFFRSASSLLRC